MKIFEKRILALGMYSALISSFVQAATYEVTAINAIDTHVNTVVIDENILGEKVLNASEVKGFNVKYEFLSDDDFSAIITDAENSHERFFGIDAIQDEEALRAHTPTENDFFWVLKFLQDRQGRFDSQQVGVSTPLINLDGTTEEIIVFDTDFNGNDVDTLNDLTRSTSDTVSGITDNGWIFGSGSAPYLPVKFTNTKGTTEVTDDDVDDYWLREFDLRAFYSIDKGQTIIQLLPPETTYGGISVISDISESGFAIGYASTNLTQIAINSINNADEDCADEELTGLPEIVCVDITLKGQRLTLSNLYSTQAYAWDIGQNGEVVSEIPLGNLITPHVDDIREASSFAQAVNDEGTIVGYADGWAKSNITNPKKDESRGGRYAVVFKGDRVVELNPKHDDHFSSRANAINSDGIATGYLNNGLRNGFYYIDTRDIDNMDMILPKGFFTGSASIAKSINDSGFIVGNGEVEIRQSQRRTHGFLYDINTKNFTDLNDYISCDAKQTITIVDANKINENNEILATAIVEANLIDAEGNILLDDDGVPRVEEVARAVKMIPIIGEIENCSGDEEDIIKKVERQGAGFGFGLLFVLTLLGLRKRL